MIARPSPSSHRRGLAFLLEAVASFTIIAVFLGTTAGVLILLFRLERSGRDDLAVTIAAGRLAAVIRDDAHAAERVEPDAPDAPPDAPRTFFYSDGATSTYRIDDHVVVRDVLDADGRGRTESYRLGPGTAARWRPGDGGLVILALEPESAPGTIVRPAIAIEAAIGRDRRHEGGPR